MTLQICKKKGKGGGGADRRWVKEEKKYNPISRVVFIRAPGNVFVRSEGVRLEKNCM